MEQVPSWGTESESNKSNEVSEDIAIKSYGSRNV